MKSQRHHHRKNLLLCGIMLLLLCICMNVTAQGTEKFDEAEMASTSKFIEQFIQEGDQNFEHQDFWTAYETYKRVLEIDPGHQSAREKVYEIAKIFKALEEVARQEHDAEKAEFLKQQHQNIVRTLLGSLTTQLKRTIKTYNQNKKREEQGEVVQEDILIALNETVAVLQELKAIYEQFPKDKTTTQQMVEKIGAAITKYEQERAQYKH